MEYGSSPRCIALADRVVGKHRLVLGQQLLSILSELPHLTKRAGEVVPKYQTQRTCHMRGDVLARHDVGLDSDQQRFRITLSRGKRLDHRPPVGGLPIGISAQQDFGGAEGFRSTRSREWRRFAAGARPAAIQGSRKLARSAASAAKRGLNVGLGFRIRGRRASPVLGGLPWHHRRSGKAAERADAPRHCCCRRVVRWSRSSLQAQVTPPTSREPADHAPHQRCLNSGIVARVDRACQQRHRFGIVQSFRLAGRRYHQQDKQRKRVHNA